MIVITPETEKFKSIFLAGTIDNGDSIDWQKKLIEKDSILLLEEKTKGDIAHFSIIIIK